MPKVNYVKAARKDNPVAKAGEPYYWWQFRNGGKRYSKTRPRQSELTQSDKLSRAYALSERLEDIALPEGDDRDELKTAVESAVDELQEVAEEVRALADEYRDSAENIRSSFSESPTADECEEKADNLDGWAEEIESAKGELEGIDFSDDSLDLDDARSIAESALTNAQDCPL